MKRVKGHRYLYRRGEHLVFRRGVPRRARAAFGKTEVLVSLGAGSISEARHILARELEKFDRLLADAMGTRSPAAVLDPVKRESTAEEAKEVVRLVTLVIQYLPHRSLMDLRRKIVRRLAHTVSIFSGVGAFDKPGAVQ